MHSWPPHETAAYRKWFNFLFARSWLVSSLFYNIWCWVCRGSGVGRTDMRRIRGPGDGIGIQPVTEFRFHCLGPPLCLRWIVWLWRSYSRPIFSVYLSASSNIDSLLWNLEIRFSSSSSSSIGDGEGRLDPALWSKHRNSLSIYLSRVTLNFYLMILDAVNAGFCDVAVVNGKYDRP